MFRICVFILVCLSFIHPVSAQSLEDKRRVEDEKREDLRPSESYLTEIQEVQPDQAHADQKAYFTRLLSQDTASLADVYKTLVTLMGLGDQVKDPDAQYDFLRVNKIIPDHIRKEDRGDILRKGDAAYMFARILHIKGGLTLRLFGYSRRYAFKELVYRRIMFPGNIHDVVSGQELIYILTRAAEYMEETDQVFQPVFQ